MRTFIVSNFTPLMEHSRSRRDFARYTALGTAVEAFRGQNGAVRSIDF